MKRLLTVIPLLLLCACETNHQDSQAVKAQAKDDLKTAQGNAERNTMHVANNVRDSVKRTSMKIREWVLTPPPEEIPTAVPSSYCYKVQQDILCYRQAMKGWESRLVGYQGTGATPPAAAQTEPLPMRRTEQLASVNTTLTTQTNAPAQTDAAKRAAKAKPIFVAIPVEPKSEPAVQNLEVGNEPLPNPTLSPQL